MAPDLSRAAELQAGRPAGRRPSPLRLQTQTPVVGPSNQSLQRDLRERQRRPAAQGNQQRQSTEAMMQADVERIVELLRAGENGLGRKMGLRSNELTRYQAADALRIILRWAEVDRLNAEATGIQETRHLDRFLQLLKQRTYSYEDNYSPIEAFKITRWANAYNNLWHQMGDAKPTLAQLIGVSPEATPPTDGPNVSFQEHMQGQYARGAVGFVLGAGKGFAGLIDAGSWLVTRPSHYLTQTETYKKVRKKAQQVAPTASAILPDKVETLNYTKEVEEGTNYLWRQIFDEKFGSGEKLVLGMDAGGIGNSGGNMAFNVALAGSGNVTQARNLAGLRVVQTTKVSQGAASAAYAVTNARGAAQNYDNAMAIIDRMAAEEKAKGRTLTTKQIWSSAEFRNEVFNMVGNAIGAVTGIPVDKSARVDLIVKGVSIFGDVLQATGYSDRLIEIFTDPKLTPEQKWAAAGPIFFDLMSKVITILVGSVNLKNDPNWAALKQQPEAPAPKPYLKDQNLQKALDEQEEAAQLQKWLERGSKPPQAEPTVPVRSEAEPEAPAYRSEMDSIPVKTGPGKPPVKHQTSATRRARKQARREEERARLAAEAEARAKAEAEAQAKAEAEARAKAQAEAEAKAKAEEFARLPRGEQLAQQAAARRAQIEQAVDGRSAQLQQEANARSAHLQQEANARSAQLQQGANARSAEIQPEVSARSAHLQQEANARSAQLQPEANARSAQIQPEIAARSAVLQQEANARSAQIQPEVNAASARLQAAQEAGAPPPIPVYNEFDLGPSPASLDVQTGPRTFGDLPDYQLRNLPESPLPGPDLAPGVTGTGLLPDHQLRSLPAPGKSVKLAFNPQWYKQRGKGLPTNKFKRPVYRFGQPSGGQDLTGTHLRVGMHYKEFTAAELKLDYRLLWDASAGRPISVSFRINRKPDVLPPEIPRQYHKEEGIQSAQPSMESANFTPWRRGHLMPHEATQRDLELGRDADQATNIVPMTPRLNEDPTSTWKQSEVMAQRQADALGYVTVKVVPHYGQTPATLPDGTPIPDGFYRIVLAPDGTTLEMRYHLNI